MFNIKNASFDIEQCFLFDHTIFSLSRRLIFFKNRDWPATISLRNYFIHPVVFSRLALQANIISSSSRHTARIPWRVGRTSFCLHSAGTCSSDLRRAGGRCPPPPTLAAWATERRGSPFSAGPLGAPSSWGPRRPPQSWWAPFWLRPCFYRGR